MLAIILSILAGPWPTVERATWPPVPSPVVAPTETVPADAKGHWEDRKTCGQYGCVTQRVWVPDETNEPEAEPQQSTHTRRRGLLRRLFGGR